MEIKGDGIAESFHKFSQFSEVTLLFVKWEKFHKFRRFTVVALLKVIEVYALTQIQGCFRASSERILLDGLTVNIWFIRFLASGVTVSHSGEGYCKMKLKLSPAPLSKQCVNRNYTVWK